MKCKKCGQENMDGTRLCRKCGTTLGKAELQSGGLPLWFGSRFAAAFALICGALAIAGVFLPWVKAVPTFQAPSGAVSTIASGWDLMTGSGHVQDGAEPYSILIFAGSIVLLLGALWAFVDLRSKNAWATTVLGGLLVIGGSVWGLLVLNDYVFAGVNAAEVSINHGAGLYLTIGGGIAGIIGGVVGRLGTSGPSLYG